MTAKDRLLQELDQTPDFLIEEVLHFLLFLKNRLFNRPPQPNTPKEDSLLNWVDRLTTQVPEAAWQQVPTDLAQNLDHYLYGSPKES